MKLFKLFESNTVPEDALQQCINLDKEYVYFKGMWDCDIEVWFSGDVSYDTSSRNPEEFDP